MNSETERGQPTNSSSVNRSANADIAIYNGGGGCCRGEWWAGNVIECGELLEEMFWLYTYGPAAKRSSHR
eukprot:scaffold276680_cov18-Prasinocladus_malaysianus.AAC.2